MGQSQSKIKRTEIRAFFVFFNIQKSVITEPLTVR